MRLHLHTVVSSVAAVRATAYRAGETQRSAFPLLRAPKVVRGGVEPPTFRFSGLGIHVQGWPRWSFSLLCDQR